MRNLIESGLRRRVAGRWMIALAAVALTLSGLECSNFQEPSGGSPNTSPFLVSSPVAGQSTTPSAVTRSTPPSSTVVYVSLPPGAIPNGLSATILDVNSGSGTSAEIVDGGFDPVALIAAVGDTLTIRVQVSGAQAPLSYTVAVPHGGPPVLVRADPPPHKRDVPVNSVIVIVFSEPLDSTTVDGATVTLMQGTTSIPGTVQFGDGTHLRAEFHPATSMVGQTDYRLLVARSVRDLNGVTLDSALSVPFTTGNLATRFSIGGTVSGLAGAGLVLELNTGETLPVNGNGPITFASTLSNGATYGISVRTLPSSPAQLCTVAQGDGTVHRHNVTDLTVECFGPDSSLKGQILFTAGSPHSHILLLDLDRATITQLTNTTADDRDPQWSPDRSRIAFIRSAMATGGTGGLWTMRADGTDAAQLLGPLDAPQLSFCWSPDGTRLALMQPESFAVVNADGSGLDSLADSLGGTTGWGDPVWSPDGSTIAYAAFPPFEDDWFVQVFLMNADGSNVRRLTSSATYGDVAPFENHPGWSPDGTKAVIWSAMYGVTVVNLADRSGFSASHEFFNPATGTGLVPASDAPDWSPDGNHLVFRRGQQLFVTAANGAGDPRQLTSVRGGVNDVAWFK